LKRRKPPIHREIVYGRNAALECLRAGRRAVHRVYLQTGSSGTDEFDAAGRESAVEEVSRDELDRLAKGGVHQGVLLEADPLPRLDARGWLSGDLPRDVIAVLLDSVTDPHNLGAVARSAVAFGARALVVPEDRAAPITPVAVKAASGALEYVDLVSVTNLARTIALMKEHEFWLAALDPEGEKELWDADLTGRIGLVVGSEGKGLRRLVRESCDFALRIPMPGPIPSLNASVSAGIALAECARQRRKAR
jgi:23S rRNA (guanosine2251-2'-O)-methyltransferase